MRTPWLLITAILLVPPGLEAFGAAPAKAAKPAKLPAAKKRAAPSAKAAEPAPAGQVAPAVPAPEEKPPVVFKKQESHQFSGTHLKGQLKKPELSYIYERKGLKQEQIVNIPERFDDEIIKGAGKF